MLAVSPPLLVPPIMISKAALSVAYEHTTLAAFGSDSPRSKMCIDCA